MCAALLLFKPDVFACNKTRVHGGIGLCSGLEYSLAELNSEHRSFVIFSLLFERAKIVL